MDTSVMFLDCPAYMDAVGAARCGLPAAVEYRYTMRSTDGLLESARIRCPRGHVFNGPLESLLWDKAPASPQSSRDHDATSRRPADRPLRDFLFRTGRGARTPHRYGRCRSLAFS